LSVLARPVLRDAFERAGWRQSYRRSARGGSGDDTPKPHPRNAR